MVYVSTKTYARNGLFNRKEWKHIVWDVRKIL